MDSSDSDSEDAQVALSQRHQLPDADSLLGRVCNPILGPLCQPAL